jgi:hypothetical protein
MLCTLVTKSNFDFDFDCPTMGGSVTQPWSGALYNVLLLLVIDLKPKRMMMVDMNISDSFVSAK